VVGQRGESAPKALSASTFSFDCLVVVKILVALDDGGDGKPMPVLPDVLDDRPARLQPRRASIILTAIGPC
jgi:hypothetical protein